MILIETVRILVYMYILYTWDKGCKVFVLQDVLKGVFMKCGVCMGLRSIPPRFDCMLLVDHLCCQIHEELPNCSRIIKTEHLCMRLGHCMELDMMLKDGIISITIQHALYANLPTKGK